MRSPDTIMYGMGTTGELSQLLREHAYERAIIVTDATIRELGVAEPVEAALESSGVEVAYFDGVKPEPKLSMVEECARTIQGSEYDVVIGLGGGSAMDTAKVASVLAVHDVPVRDLLGMGNVPGEGLDVVLVPTTAGTGSEVTHIGVFADCNDGGNKKVCYSDHLFAEAAIIDPNLTKTLPKPIAASTGLDALTHAIESYVSLKRTPFSDMLARRAIELIGVSIRKAVHQGRNNDLARYRMCLAAMMAGQAFVNSGLGAVHAVTYPLGVRHGLGHGRANAIMLPHVMEYNVPAEPERFADIADLLGAEFAPSDTTIDKAYEAVEVVTDLTKDVGIRPTLREIQGISEDEFEEFTEVAFEYSRHNIDRNPRSLEKTDVVSIFNSAY